MFYVRLMLVLVLLTPARALPKNTTTVWICAAVVGIAAGGMIGGYRAYQSAMQSLRPAISPAKYDINADTQYSEIELTGFEYRDLERYLLNLTADNRRTEIAKISDAKLGRLLLFMDSEYLREEIENDLSTTGRKALVTAATDQERAAEDEVVEPSDSGNIGQSEDDHSSPNVMMGEYIFTDSKHHERVLSAGAGPCVIVTLWDKKSRTGMMVHFPDQEQRTIAAGLDRILAEFEAKNISLSDLEVGLVGGRPGQSDRFLGFITHRLKSSGITSFKYLFTLQGGAAKSAALDLRTGAVTLFKPMVSPNSSKASEAKSQRVLRGLFQPAMRHESSLPSPVFAEP